MVIISKTNNVSFLRFDKNKVYQFHRKVFRNKKTILNNFRQVFFETISLFFLIFTLCEYFFHEI